MALKINYPHGIAKHTSCEICEHCLTKGGRRESYLNLSNVK